MQVQQLLRALQYMHDERGIMHGDIKPDNLLLVGSSLPCSPLPLNNYCSAVLKIADFGLAKQLQVGRAFDRRNAPTLLLQARSSDSIIAQAISASTLVQKGTVGYMSPSILCHNPRTYSDDVWSACLVIAEIGLLRARVCVCGVSHFLSLAHLWALQCLFILILL